MSSIYIYDQNLYKTIPNETSPSESPLLPPPPANIALSTSSPEVEILSGDQGTTIEKEGGAAEEMLEPGLRPTKLNSGSQK